MKNSLPIIIAALLLCLSAVFFFVEMPDDSEQVAVEKPGRERPEAPIPPPPAYIPPAVLPPPLVSKLSNPLLCLEVEGDRYGGELKERFDEQPREGIVIFNGCAEPLVLADVKVNETSVAYVSSILPSTTILIDPRTPQLREKDRMVTLTRGGTRCDGGEPVGATCRFLPVPPKQTVFISVPVKHWFSIWIKDGMPVTGFLMEPFDPKAPKKKPEIPKMPEKGFKFKKTGPY